MDRRNFIHASLATASALTLAGCAEQSNNPPGNGNGETPAWGELSPPAYAQWLPQTDSEGYVFSHLDTKTLSDLKGIDQSLGGSGSNSGSGDGTGMFDEYNNNMALFALPISGAFATMFGSAFGLMFYPFSTDLFPSMEDSSGGDDSVEGVDTQSMTLTDNGMVFLGEFDREVFNEKYTTRTGFDGEEVKIFEKRDSRGGFDIYGEPDESSSLSTQPLAYAVSDSAVVVPFSENTSGSSESGSEQGESKTNEEILTAMLDRRLGESPQITGSEAGEFLLGSAGNADLVTGFWNTQGLESTTEDATESDSSGNESTEPSGSNGTGTEPSFEDIGVSALEKAKHLVSGMSFDDDGTITVECSIVYPDGEAPSVGDLEGTLFTGEATAIEYGTPDITVDGNRAYVSVTVEDSPIDDDSSNGTSGNESDPDNSE